MKFEVNYFSQKNFWDFSNYATFSGKGFIFLQDTGLVLEGTVAKFEAISSMAMYEEEKNIFFVSTTRTIPYSVIIKYKKTRFWHNYHQITYRLPDGKKSKIGFRMTKPRIGQKNAAFTSKLEDYLKTVKSIISG
jgi:hypothetical protein